jgi:hypothetical protein
MTSRISLLLLCIVACTFVTAVTDVSAQVRGGARTGGAAPQAAAAMPSDPLTGPVMAGAPYSGIAQTTITQTLGDGTRIEQRAEARFYRDSVGRVRREQTIMGLGALNPSAQPQTVVTIDPTPGGPFAYTLDPAARTARRVPRAGGGYGLTINWVRPATTDRARELERAANKLQGVNSAYFQMLNPQGLAIAPLGIGGMQTREALGTRQMEGVRVTGTKATSIIAAGQIGNDRPIEITDERWESPELGLLVYSRFSDPRTGIVEFKLTNITRAEQSAELFTVPADYTTIPFPVTVEPNPGARGRGAGGRGQ